MTWAQLRFQLIQSGPGTSLDLLESWLNTRYEQVLEATDWTGIRARATLTTQAAYQSGTDTVTLTVGNPTVTGVGTSWDGTLVGRRFYRPGDTALYTVAVVSGPNTLTLDRVYEGNGTDATGTVYAGSAYVFMQNVYPLPSDCRSVDRILDPVTGLPLTAFSAAELDAAVGPRTNVGYPHFYAEIEDSAEAAPPVLHQVEMYPAPANARGFTVEYLRASYALDGTNLSQSPLPFVSASVLLFGARADLYTHLGKIAQAAVYEAKFEEELKRLLLVEHAQRREKPTMRMADRFTRHRLARASRGLNTTWRGGEPGGPN